MNARSEVYPAWRDRVGRSVSLGRMMTMMVVLMMLPSAQLVEGHQFNLRGWCGKVVGACNVIFQIALGY